MNQIKILERVNVWRLLEMENGCSYGMRFDSVE
jgi:hypothetical protein